VSQSGAAPLAAVGRGYQRRCPTGVERSETGGEQRMSGGSIQLIRLRMRTNERIQRLERKRKKKKQKKNETNSMATRINQPANSQTH
jgi:hypothetical protein